MEKKGITVNYTLFDKEAELMKHMKNSEDDKYRRLRNKFWDLCETHLEKPKQLASDYVLARVYKHCLIFLDLESILGHKEIENEYYHFKEMFYTKARKEEHQKEFFSIVRQIFSLKTLIMTSA